MKLKKTILLIPLLSSFFFINSCNKLPNKVNTLYGIENSNKRSMIEIYRSDLDTFMAKDANKTFILVQLTKTCHCSFEFEDIVNEYIKETGIVIYSIDYEQVKDTNYGFAFRSDSPTLHVVYKGNNLGNLEKYDDNKFFASKDAFKSYMDAHISKPSLFKVTIDELNNLYAKDNPFAVYFAKLNCAECEYFDKYILNDYAQAHLDMKKMYYIDLNEYPTLDKGTYGLTETSNELWGYKNGAFPVIHYIEPKDAHSKNNSTAQAFMFGNDILDNNYKIIESYYNEKRINKINYSRVDTSIGKQYRESDTKKDGEYIVLKNENSDELYRNTAIDFMNYLQDKLS